MPLYRLDPDSLKPIDPTTLAAQGVWERADLQRLLRDRIEVILPDTLVIAEEFSDWSDSSRRIDLLCLARDGALVVVELKRGQTGRDMDLQGLRYAAMVSTMKFDQAVAAHERFLRRQQRPDDARARILSFLGWEEPDPDEFAQAVRIVLLSEDFGPELTTAVLWLNGRGLDIRCVRLNSYEHAGVHLIQFEPIIPLPEAADYQIRVRDKELEASRAREQRRDPAPELLAAVEAYERFASPEFPVSGRAWNYRQIKPTNWRYPGKTHYEFLYSTRKYLGAELHIEHAWAQPVAEVLRPLDGERLEGIETPLVWDPAWRGMGRLTCRLPLDTPPDQAARAMQALIARTHEPVTQKLEELEAEEGGENE